METSLKLIETAVKLNLDLVGVSFHVGSGQMEPRAFSESIENARKLFDYARENFGIRMHLLDLGGGYPGSSDSQDLFIAIAKEINRALDEHFPTEFFAQLNGTDEHKLKVIAEPGRYYACSAFTLCVNVIAKRVMNQTPAQQNLDREAALRRQKEDKERLPSSQTEQHGCLATAVPHTENVIDTSKSIMYYINDGVYASFNCLFYDHAECFPILIKEDRAPTCTMYKSSLWGPTCDGLDVIQKECFLPELETGEFLVFKNMGAYTIAGAVPFNGIPLARCIYTASTSWSTIKYAFDEQSLEDNLAINMFIDTAAASAISGTCASAAKSEGEKHATFDSSDEETHQRFNDKLANEESASVLATTTPITC